MYLIKCSCQLSKFTVVAFAAMAEPAFRFPDLADVNLYALSDSDRELSSLIQSFQSSDL